jgi:hypothetical protein
LYKDGLGQIFDLFSRKIQDFPDFLKENLEFFKSEKGIFYQILSHLAMNSIFFLTPEFLKELQNIKILSMRYTKLAQMRLVAKISVV